MEIREYGEFRVRARLRRDAFFIKSMEQQHAVMTNFAICMLHYIRITLNLFYFILKIRRTIRKKWFQTFDKFPWNLVRFFPSNARYHCISYVVDVAAFFSVEQLSIIFVSKFSATDNNSKIPSNFVVGFFSVAAAIHNTSGFVSEWMCVCLLFFVMNFNTKYDEDIKWMKNSRRQSKHTVVFGEENGSGWREWKIKQPNMRFGRIFSACSPSRGLYFRVFQW